MVFVHLVAHLQSLYKTLNLPLAQTQLLKPVFPLKNIENGGKHITPISGRGGINLSAIFANAVPREVILHWFLCDEYSTAGLLPSPLVQVQDVVSWDGTSPELHPERLFRLGHRKVLYSLLLNSFRGILQCFVKTLSGSALQYVFVSPVSAPQLHLFLLPLQLPREEPSFKLNLAKAFITLEE